MPKNNDLYSDQWEHVDPEKVITEAIAKLADDAGAVLENDVLEAFKLLYQANPASYNRYRQQVKESKKVVMALFDKLTTKELEPEQNSKPNLQRIFPIYEVWDSPVNGAELLDEIKETIKQYVIADDETFTVATLWACFTWFIDVVSYAPIANVTAPEKRCGKTKLLSTLKRLSYKSFSTSNISPAALFRLIELHKPTLFVDEVDTFLKEHNEMKGMINAGYTRETAFIVRCVGEEQEPQPFSIWGAKLLCGIGKIADTLHDRSITLKLRRKTIGETVKNIDKSDPREWQILRAKLARFAKDHSEQLETIQPDPIKGLHDRANDCYEPLLQVAILAGGHWLETVKKAALVLNGTEEESDSIRTELLRDIQTIFTTKRIERIFSHELVNELNADNEANWCVWNNGRGITPRNLAKYLKEFGIVSKSMRIGFDNAKGYSKKQFTDTFNRYLNDSRQTPNITTVTTTQSNGHNEYSQEKNRHNNELLPFENQPKAKRALTCDIVTYPDPKILEAGQVSKPESHLINPQNHSNSHSINDLLEDAEGVSFDL